MNLFLLMQLADSAFPTGGFAHAAGLEAARALGLVTCGAELEEYASELLWSTGEFALPFASASFDAPSDFFEIDARCDAFTPGHIANRASRAQGQALLRSSGEILGGPTADLALRVRRERSPGHWAPALGAVLAHAGADRETAQRLLLFSALRGLFAAAVRLGLVGPLEAQTLQAALSPEAEAVALACAARTLDEAAQPTPLLELVQAHQDRLYSRLFQS